MTTRVNGMSTTRISRFASAALFMVVVAGIAAPSDASPALWSAAISLPVPPWWRMPIIHTGQESFFLRWMDARFGSAWLHWMRDDEIALHWRWFIMFGSR